MACFLSIDRGDGVGCWGTRKSWAMARREVHRVPGQSCWVFVSVTGMSVGGTGSVDVDLGFCSQWKSVRSQVSSGDITDFLVVNLDDIAFSGALHQSV